jgi:hypothetical protein
MWDHLKEATVSIGPFLLFEKRALVVLYYYLYVLYEITVVK